MFLIFCFHLVNVWAVLYLCFCAMLSLSQVDPPKIFVFLCWRLSIIPPLMITGIRDSSDLTNRETALVNTDQSEGWWWRVENLENLRAATRKVQQNILREWKRIKHFRINPSLSILCLSKLQKMYTYISPFLKISISPEIRWCPHFTSFIY